jgi:hypothetical protein
MRPRSPSHQDLRYAKTYSAWPPCGILMSGASRAGATRGLPPPSPVITATYCCPSMLQVTGNPLHRSAQPTSHNIWPGLSVQNMHAAIGIPDQHRNHPRSRARQ